MQQRDPVQPTINLKIVSKKFSLSLEFLESTRWALTYSFSESTFGVFNFSFPECVDGNTFL